jgi:hypothetical protein
MASSLRVGLLLAVLWFPAAPAAATTVTLSQAQLLSLDEITAFFGGNGQVLSRTPDGGGVLFEIEGGTIDYGKVALRLLMGGADLTGYDRFGLRFEVVSAPNPVELNPFIQTEPSGTNFVEDEPGVKVQGDSFDSFVPLAGVTALDDTFALGFQYFTSIGVIDPPSQIALIRVLPIPGADYALPEPAAPMLLALTGAVLFGLSRSRWAGADGLGLIRQARRQESQR